MPHKLQSLLTALRGNHKLAEKNKEEILEILSVNAKLLADTEHTVSTLLQTSAFLDHCILSMAEEIYNMQKTITEDETQ